MSKSKKKAAPEQPDEIGQVIDNNEDAISPDADEASGEAVIETIEVPAGADQADEDLELSDELEETDADIISTELNTLLNTDVGRRAAIEALLFISPDPLGPRKLANALGLPNTQQVIETVESLRAEYEEQRRGMTIVETAGGYQMATIPVFADLVLRLKNRKRRPSLGPAALETLAIIGYRQPIIRAEIEAVRGVESSGTIRNLIDMGLVEMCGRKEVLGRPPMYGTTEAFLRAFGLKSIKELPPIAELKQQLTQKQAEADRIAAEKAEAERRAAGEQLEIPILEGDEGTEAHGSEQEDDVESDGPETENGDDASPTAGEPEDEGVKRETEALDGDEDAADEEDEFDEDDEDDFDEDEDDDLIDDESFDEDGREDR